MSLRNNIFDSEFQSPRGLDTTSPIATVQPGYVREAKNVNLGLSGGYTKREGYENQASTPWGSRDVTAGIEYKTAAGLTKVLVFGTDGTASGGIFGEFASGSVSAISSSLSGTVRPNFVQFDALCFFYNGTDAPILYDGTATRQVGITKPATAPTAVQGTTGSLTQLGTYIAAYTYYNSVTGAESSPSALSASVTLTGANDDITWTISAGSATTADTIRFYRSVANGNTLYLEGTAAISATSFISTAADSALGRQIELDNSRITDLLATSNYARFPTVADNRVFLKTGVNEIRFSKIGQEGPMPESFEAKAVVTTVGRLGANDDIVGLNRINQLPIVIKESSLGRLDPIGLPDTTLSRDNVAYVYREISDVVGGVSHNAAAQVLGELVFLSKDNIYATDGIRVRPIADSIQATIRSLGFTSTQRPQLSMINDVEKRRIYISCFASSIATNPTTVLVGDYQLYPDFRWTTYEPGTNTTTHPGIIPGCFFHVTNTSTGKLDVYFGNTQANGKIYKMNEGDNDDTKGIYMRIVTRPYFGGNPLLYKLYKKAEIQAQGDGNDYDLTICTIYDLTGTEEECIPLSLYANAYLYDNASSLYDTAMYADDSVKQLEYYMHRKAKYLQLVIKQTEADAPVDLFAWGTYASGFGPSEGPKRSSD